MQPEKAVKKTTPLKDKVPVTGSGAPDLSAVRRAEQALVTLSRNFDNWIDEEAVKLMAARNDIHAHGIVGEYGKTLFRVAHDLKGQGDTFGYPMVTQLCTCLCRLLEAGMAANNTPINLVELHINAIRAVIRDRTKGNENQLANSLVSELAQATEAFLATTAQIQAAKANARE